MMGGARAAAEAAVRDYLSDPASARERAEAALRAAQTERDWAAAGIAHRALGLVAGHLSHSGDAEDHLRRAIRFSRRAGAEVNAARSRTDLAYVLARQGRTAPALRQIALARPVLDGPDGGRLLMMQALVFKAMGRRLDALGAYQRALPLIRAAADPRLLAELLGNRGVIQMDLGLLDRAERDFDEAARLFESLGAGLPTAITLHNLACIAAFRGDVPGAIAGFDAAEEAYVAHRGVPLELWRDRCEMLIGAGLAAEARDAAERAVALAAERAEPGELAEARVRLAQAALGEGDRATVETEATAALRTFRRQLRPAWVAFAQWVRVQGRLLGPAPRVTSAQLRRIRDDLVASGFSSTAVDAGMLTAQLAIRERRVELARSTLVGIAAMPGSGPIWPRTQAWHARALLAELDGDPAGARRAVQRGLQVVADYRAALGATELQAVAAQRVSALADLGLRNAVGDGRPSLVLAWAERSRAAHLLSPPRPPADPELARDLSALRLLTAQRVDAVRSGAPGQPELVARQVTLERAIRHRIRKQSAAPTDARPARPAGAGDLSDRLGDRALIEFLSVDGAISAVTVVAGRARRHRLCDVADIDRERRLVPFLLRRLARPAGRPAAVEAGVTALHRTGETLDRLLIAPMHRIIGDRPLVLVPGPDLAGVHWSLLPSLRGRPVTLSPSATLWTRSWDRSAANGGATVLAAGPGLSHAQPEVAALAGRYPEATVLVGADATVPRLLRAMDGARLVHIAAHGHFRHDNPMFSDLIAQDGPLWVYDLESMGSAPHTVVISACQAGRTAELPGGEVLGLASELLRIGVSSLIGSLVDIADAHTAPMMVDLHERLVADGPAAALAAVQHRAFDGDPSTLAVAAGFVCLGAGWSR